MEMSTVKTVAVFIIIFGCFAVLYPKIFHPIFMHLIGAAPKRQTSDDVLNRIPPHLRHGRPMNTPEENQRNMRAGSHPGLRAAADMKKQAATSTPGAGKGMMSIVLPMYAVGIVVYLVYTLSKVFGKKEKPPSEDYLSNDPFKDIRYDAEKHKFRHRAEEDEDEAEDPDMKEYRKSTSNKRDLENLLLKADERNITEIEMRQLKDRLLETETQMNRILKAMEMVQKQVGETNEEHLSQQAKAAMETLQRAKGTTDLSPDMEGYDIISGGSSPIEEIGHMDVSVERKKGYGAETSRKNDNSNRGREETDQEVEETVGQHNEFQDEESNDENADIYDDGDAQESSEDENVEEIIDSQEDTDDDHPDLRMRITADSSTAKRKDTTDCDIDTNESNPKKD